MSELKTNLQSILQEKNTKIIPQNIKKDVEVLGITGSYDKEDIHVLEAELADAQNELADVRRDLDNSTATVSGSGENITLSGTAEARFKKAPLPLGNTEQEVIEAQAGTTVEGESILANGVDLSKVEILNINGNTKQETTTGKNLYDDNFDDYNQPYDYYIYPINLEQGETYTLSATLVGSNVNGVAVAIVPFGEKYSDFSDNMQMCLHTDGTTNVKTFTVNDTWTSPKLVLYLGYSKVKSVFDSVFENYEIQLEKSSTKTDYEPYTGGKASPNPDYPQEIKSVGDNVNLFDKQNATSKIGYIKDDNGNEVPTGGFSYTTSYIKVNPNTTYTLSGKLVNNNGTARTYYYDKNKNWISRSTGFGVNVNVCTFTTPQNCEYIQFQYINEAFDIDTIKLEKGSKATVYSAYNQGNMNVEISNKNLFDKTRADVVEGYFNSSGEVVLGGTSSVTRGYIPIIPNTDMVLSGMPFTVYAFYDENKNFIERIIQGAESYAFNKNAHYMRFQGYTTDFDIDSVQLEQGSTATTYVAHEGQSFIIPTQAPFRKIGDYKDTFVKKVDGKWYEKHAIAEVILDGSESNWSLASSTDDYYEFQCNNVLNPVAVSGYTFPISSYFSNRTYNRVVANAHLVLIRVPSTSNITTAEEFKTWLSTHNTIVNYVLKEPIYIECTSEQSAILDQINTFYETTNIFSTDEVSPNFTFIYNKVYASPSPDDESPIQTVSGDVEVLVQNKNLLKLDDFAQKVINSPYNAGNISTYDSETGALNVMMGKESIGTLLNDFKENTRYTIIFKYKRMNTSDLNSNISIQYTDGTVYDFVLPNENGVLKYITTNNKTVSKIYHTAKNSGGTRTLYLKESGIFEGVLNEIDFIPHKEQILPLTLKSKNLFDGEIELGSINPANGELQPSTARTRSKNFLKVKPNTTYTISVQTGQFRWIIGYTVDKIGITDGNASGHASAISTFPVSTEKTNTFTTTATTEYIKWYDTSSTDLTEKVQLEEGSTATSYEPYYNYELCKIGDYQDYFWKDETTSKWYLHKEIDKTVLDGTQTGLRAPAVEGYRFCIDLSSKVITSSVSEVAKLYSNKFKGISRDNSYSNIQGIAFSDSARNYKDLIIYCEDTKNMTFAEFQTWLSTHNTEVYYPLVTPTDTEITETTLINQLDAISKAISYDEQTNVSSNTIALFDIIALRNMNTILNTLENDVDLLE